MRVLNETIGKVVFNCSRDTLNLVTLGVGTLVIGYVSGAARHGRGARTLVDASLALDVRRRLRKSFLHSGNRCWLGAESGFLILLVSC